MITLDQIEKNQRGRIVEIDTDLLPLKLIEMGCLPGNEVHLEQLAPLKDPMTKEARQSPGKFSTTA